LYDLDENISYPSDFEISSIDAGDDEPDIEDRYNQKKDWRMMVKNMNALTDKRGLEESGSDEDITRAVENKLNKFVMRVTVRDKKKILELIGFIEKLNGLKLEINQGKFRKREVKWQRQWEFVDNVKKRILYGKTDTNVAEAHFDRFKDSATPVKNWMKYKRHLEYLEDEFKDQTKGGHLNRPRLIPLGQFSTMAQQERDRLAMEFTTTKKEQSKKERKKAEPKPTEPDTGQNNSSELVSPKKGALKGQKTKEHTPHPQIIRSDTFSKKIARFSEDSKLELP
jgi:hypothetical protein